MNLAPVLAVIKGDDIVGMIVALAVGIYLVYALVKAERL